MTAGNRHQVHAALLAAAMACAAPWLVNTQAQSGRVAIDPDDIGGTVTTNGDGKITQGWTEPDQPIDSAKDHRIDFGCYSVAVNPKDNSLWCSGIGRGQKRLMRLERGTNPPLTCKAEFFEPPPSLPISTTRRAMRSLTARSNRRWRCI